MEALVPPPPMRLNGILMAFEVEWDEKTCSRSGAQSEGLPDSPVVRWLESRLSARVEPQERQEILALTRALVSGDLENILSTVRTYNDKPKSLAKHRDILRLVLSEILVDDVEIIATEPFRLRVGNATTDAVNLVLRNNSNSLVIGLSSYCDMAPQVFRMTEFPDGKRTLDPEMSVGAPEVFTSISRLIRRSKQNIAA